MSSYLLLLGGVRVESQYSVAEARQIVDQHRMAQTWIHCPDGELEHGEAVIAVLPEAEPRSSSFGSVGSNPSG